MGNTQAGLILFAVLTYTFACLGTAIGASYVLRNNAFYHSHLGTVTKLAAMLVGFAAAAAFALAHIYSGAVVAITVAMGVFAMLLFEGIWERTPAIVGFGRNPHPGRH